MKEIRNINGHDVYEYREIHIVYYNKDLISKEGYYLFAPFDSEIDSTATEWFWENITSKSAFLGETETDVEKLIDDKIEKYKFDTEIGKFNL